jgi:dTDP-4-dehydrorhamnose 3,5-epimerase
MSFQFERSAIPDVLLATPKVHVDPRGWFMESHKFSEWSAYGVTEAFLQENHSYSTYGTVRGLHFQRPPKAQAKLVRVIQGAVFDVAVDIRKGSPTYGQWVGTTLSAENKRMIYVPAGFAHGFCVTSETAELIYKVTSEYAPNHEGGVIWNDPKIAIEWPIHAPVLSQKDEVYPLLAEMETPFVWKGIL